MQTRHGQLADERQENPARSVAAELLPFVLLASGLLVRLILARASFLNADEALHYLLSVQPSVARTYQASLTTAHPPLLIVLLHYWSRLGTSEFVLRLPSVLAGTAFCWIMFLWLKSVTDRKTALVGLTLLLFSPALILLSTEVRQYALLMLFLACSLYFLELAIGEGSKLRMFLSILALGLAICTHYSSLIAAMAIGIYALARWRQTRHSPGVAAVWAAGQMSLLGLVVYLFMSHVAKLKAKGIPGDIAATYLYRSLFHPGRGTAISFVVKSNIRLFHYLISQSVVGVLGMLLFVTGMVLLARQRNVAPTSGRPSPRQLALLLIVPFAANCCLALAGIYPYGGSRHNSYLTGFAMSGIAIALARWSRPKWLMPLAVGIALVACNLYPAALGEYIQPKNQSRKLMTEAMTFLRSLPPGSIIFTDDQGGLLLSYYLCHARVVQIEEDPFLPFLDSSCGDYRVLSIDPHDHWIFQSRTFPDQVAAVQRVYHLSEGTTLWVFQAGWLVNMEPDLHAQLARFHCREKRFGQNMFVCPLLLDAERNPLVPGASTSKIVPK
jgi:4-amino-4-deoxy-L-arabinose transferase-like glycosyltransferase